MRFDQYSSVLQLAAALILAGWVARTPDGSQADLDTIGSEYGASNPRYHPYANPNNHGWYESGNFGPMVQEQFPSNYPGGRESLYQSKDAEQSFQAFLELQELLSWEEAYRRGDLHLGSGSQYALPVVKKEDNPSTIIPIGQSSSSSSANDDGYGSGGTSIGSPASVLSGISSNNVDYLTVYSPAASSVFDLNENLELSGAVGYSPASYDQNDEFDIDELIDIDDIDFPKEILEDTKSSKDGFDVIKRPFENLKHVDNDLEYVNSPLKSPTFDEFLASPKPGHSPNNPSLDRSYDDPFNMQFTNSSVPHKFISDTLQELGDFDPSAFDTLASDEEIDKALVESLSAKNTKLSGAAAVFPNNPDVKPKISLRDSLQHVTDHDYQKQIKEESTMEFSPTKTTTSFNKFFNPSTLPQSSRSYAPPSTNRHASPKTMTQENKRSLVWPDFAYTSDELIDMPVETFNEVVKTLDEVKQHVAKDIRRKGKNKFAARNCRKRKMDVIEHLDNGVGELEQDRINLLEERQRLLEETQQIQRKTEWLNSYIFQQLRDANGSPYSSSDYSLQYTSDGNVYLVPSAQNEVKTFKNVRV